jgi:putative ABC transport system ATP-binding protein
LFSTAPATDRVADGQSAVPVLELDRAARTYPGPPPIDALKPTTLVVAAGEYVAITGPSGSGKSTLLNLMGLLDRPTGGRVIVDGIDTSALSERDRTAMRGRRIGFVFQAFHLMPHRSAAENVALAGLYQKIPAHVRRDAAQEALALVGLVHRADALPTQLSGGERQRVAIARALATRPSLLLCDEPTGNLDTVATGALLDVLDDLNTRLGTTLLVITHDLSVAARSHRHISIRDGVLVPAD